MRDSRGRRSRGARAVWAIALGLALGAATVAVAGTEASATGSSTAHAQAKQALLKRSDFPTQGWSTSPNDTDGGNGWPAGAAGTAFATCLGIPASVLSVHPPSAGAPEFDESEDTYAVDEEIEVFPSAQAAATDVGVGGNPKAPACYQQLLAGPFGNTFAKGLADAFGGGATVGEMAVKALPVPGDGQESAAMQIAVPITDNGSTTVLYLEDAAIAQGPSEASFLFFSAAGPFPAHLAAHLEKVAAQRLKG